LSGFDKAGDASPGCELFLSDGRVEANPGRCQFADQRIIRQAVNEALAVAEFLNLPAGMSKDDFVKAFVEFRITY